MNLKTLKKRLKIKLEPYDLEFNFISKLIDARIIAGLTQGELAKRCGMLQESIARIEAGRSVPNLRTISRIAKALKRPLIIHFKQ